MFRSIGPWEIGLILVIVLIIFGVGRLPQVGGAIGKGIRMFRKSVKGEEDEEEITKAETTKADASKDATPKNA